MPKIIAILVLAAAAAAAQPVHADTASAACPTRLPATVVSARSGAARTLVPAGAVSLLLCSYHGLNPASESGKLERSRTVTAPAELAWLVRTFDALKASRGVMSCPMDDGATDLALFGYSASPLDPVSVGLTGCTIVTNGHITRTAALPPGPALLDRLAALIG